MSRRTIISRWLRANDRIAMTAMYAVFAVLILAGATTSSLGIAGLSENGSQDGVVQIGDSRWIRSDEYQISTPIALSIMETGGAPSLGPLSTPGNMSHRYASDGFFETVVFFHSDLLRLGTFLPQQMVFAAYWWLPVIFLFAFLPRWFEQVAGARRLGWLAALLIFLSPSVAWWSMAPVQCVAFAVAGSSLLISAYQAAMERRRWRALAFAAPSSILLAGIPTLYAPWAIVLSVPVLAASVVWILTRTTTSWSSRLVPVMGVGLVSVIFAAGTFLENAASIQSMLGTVYPGSRRSTGESQPLALLFGAPGLAELSSSDPVSSNASELSSSYTIVFVWIAILLASTRRLGRFREHPVEWVIGASGVIWLLWVTVPFGGLGERIPVLNLVPSFRAAAVVGILGILFLCLALAGVELATPARTATIAALSTAVVTAAAIANLRDYLPEISTWVVWGAAAALAVVVFCVTFAPRSWWVIGLATVAAAAVIVNANPVVIGLGGLRGSATIESLTQAGKEARSDGSLWVSDSIGFDAAAVASGVPMLSGFQRSGPDRSQWAKLDPDNEFETAWNRGGGYAVFYWADGASTRIETNGFDVVATSIDPCDLADAFPRVSHLVSTTGQPGDCLELDRELEWAGRAFKVYRVTTD